MPTHTHTHVCFCELWGHHIGVMVFKLYKPYFLSPYINPTLKPTNIISQKVYISNKCCSTEFSSEEQQISIL